LDLNILEVAADGWPARTAGSSPGAAGADDDDATEIVSSDGGVIFALDNETLTWLSWLLNVGLPEDELLSEIIPRRHAVARDWRHCERFMSSGGGATSS